MTLAACTSRMVRVRLGGEGGASYGVRTDWPDQGTMAAVVATPGSVVLNLSLIHI